MRSWRSLWRTGSPSQSTDLPELLKLDLDPPPGAAAVDILDPDREPRPAVSGERRRAGPSSGCRDGAAGRARGVAAGVTRLQVGMEEVEGGRAAFRVTARSPSA